MALHQVKNGGRWFLAPLSHEVAEGQTRKRQIIIGDDSGSGDRRMPILTLIASRYC
jgi:hypothetical protein